MGNICNSRLKVCSSFSENKYTNKSTFIASRTILAFAAKEHKESIVLKRVVSKEERRVWVVPSRIYPLKSRIEKGSGTRPLATTRPEKTAFAKHEEDVVRRGSRRSGSLHPEE